MKFKKGLLLSKRPQTDIKWKDILKNGILYSNNIGINICSLVRLYIKRSLLKFCMQMYSTPPPSLSYWKLNGTRLIHLLTSWISIVSKFGILSEFEEFKTLSGQAFKSTEDSSLCNYLDSWKRNQHCNNWKRLHRDPFKELRSQTKYCRYKHEIYLNFVFLYVILKNLHTFGIY